MEQLRHRLTDVSPKGQRRSVDQNTLKRTELDDFISCYFGSSGSVSAPRSEKRRAGTRPLKAVEFENASPRSEDKESAVTDRRYSGNRHERKETARFNPDKSGANRFERKESERFRSFTYGELIKRDKINLDILTPSFPTQSASRPARLILRAQRIQVWLKDESREDSANLPDPEAIAADIVEDLEAALQQFAAIASDLNK